MRESKHTPGPWVIETMHAHGPLITDMQGGAVARVESLDGVDADARLIAAAPDLLEALRFALDRGLLDITEAALTCPDDGPARIQEMARNLALKAIAKAEGSTP